MTTSTRTSGRIGYACGAARVSTDPASESIGPRAHVVGFLGGLEACGVEHACYLAGDDVPAQASESGSGERVAAVPGAQYAADAARMALRVRGRRRALRRLADVDLLYERQATFQDIGRPFRRRGTPWVIESNGPFWYEAGKERSTLGLPGLAKRIELAAYRDADLVVAVSDSLKDIIVREVGCRPDHVHVLPNATDPERFSPDGAEAERFAGADEVVVGFVGFLSRWAGTDLLLEAAGAVMAEDPRLRLTIVGDGPARADLEGSARDLGIAERVHFTGHVAWGRVPDLMAGFDVAYSGQRRMAIGAMYHSPQKLYEYQAMALPLVASDHADARSLVEASGAGWLFPSEDVPALADVLRTVLRDGGLRDRGAAGRRAILEHHSWAARVSGLLTELRTRGLLERTPDEKGLA